MNVIETKFIVNSFNYYGQDSVKINLNSYIDNKEDFQVNSLKFTYSNGEYAVNGDTDLCASIIKIENDINLEWDVFLKHYINVDLEIFKRLLSLCGKTTQFYFTIVYTPSNNKSRTFTYSDEPKIFDYMCENEIPFIIFFTYLDVSQIFYYIENGIIKAFGDIAFNLAPSSKSDVVDIIRNI